MQAVDVMKRTTKYNFKLTWSEAIKPFLNCVVRNNAPAQASYLFNSIKLSPLLLEMETSVLNRLLPLTQSNHCKWMLPPLLRRLEKEEKWTRFQYHTVVQSLLMSRDADSLISVYERWCEQSLVEPKLREEATVKLVEPPLSLLSVYGVAHTLGAVPARAVDSAAAASVPRARQPLPDVVGEEPSAPDAAAPYS